MSMTSKVNANLRTAILTSLALSPKTNSSLFYNGFVNPTGAISVRKIQEATQKLTREGLLTRSRGIYSITSQNVATSAATV